MANAVEIGPRSEADVALDLMKFIYTSIPNKPDSETELLTLYHKCRYEVVRSLIDLRK
jgi:hypothetical protein